MIAFPSSDVATNPYVHNVLIEKIRSAEAAGKIFQPIKHQEAQSLPYLQVVIKEAVLIHPAIRIASLRVIPTGGASICGFFILEGTWITMTPRALSWRKGTYGEDAELFVQERYLVNEERSKSWGKIGISFGAGYCGCL
jgi:hypothetical protein